MVAPPVFPGDDEKTRRAAFLNVILLLGLLTQLFAPVMWSGSLLRQVVMTSVFLAICLGNLILLRFGFVRAAATVFLSVFWMMATAAIVTCGGIRAPGFSGYFLITGCAGMLLGWRAMAGYTAASVLAGLGLTLAELNGWVDYSHLSDSPFSAWLTFSIILTMCTASMGLAMHYIRQSRIKAEREASQRQLHEQALLRSEQAYREIFNAASEAILIHDAATGEICDANQATLDMFHFAREELLRLSLVDIADELDDHSRAGAQAAFGRAKEQGPQVLEWRCRRKAGPPFWAEISLRSAHIGERLCVLAVVRDITERRRIEEEVRQLQKEESIGRLAGGVAHDFNNILMAIQGMTEMLRNDLAQRTHSDKRLDAIEKATQRGASLTRQLLAFARRQVIQPSQVGLNDLVGRVAEILRPLLGEPIELKTNLFTGLSAVSIDSNQFEQVLINLAVNARDAMPRGGKLLIETGNVTLDEIYCSQNPDVAPGPYVMLAVSDTGTGMDSETVKRIFEPFFTTKAVGKGTGLGLAMCFGIVKQNHGHISVYSEPGHGTTFRIYLPASGALPTATREIAPVAVIPRGSETILFVEDDPMIRQTVATILTDCGYHVHEADNGESALVQARSMNQPIDLLITDMVMPKMGGRELAEQLRKERPSMRVIYTSGYTEPTITSQELLRGDAAFIAKPYSTDALMRKLRSVMAAQS